MIGGRIEKSCWKAGKARRFRFVAEESDAEEQSEEKKILTLLQVVEKK